MESGLKQKFVVATLLIAAFAMLLDTASITARTQITDLQATIARADLVHQLALEKELADADATRATELLEDLQDSKEAVDDLNGLQSIPLITAPELNPSSIVFAYHPLIPSVSVLHPLIAPNADSLARRVIPPPHCLQQLALEQLNYSIGSISRRGPPACV